MRAEEIDALLGGEAQKLADKYTSVPLDFMDGYGWAVTQICRLFPEVVPARYGEWIDPHDPWAGGICSACGYQTGERMGHLKLHYRYCPNCGARMDAERKEE